jgi:5-methylcytosine-specific restriction endonuclease McrA
MGYSFERLERIFDKTSGYCHICCGKLAWRNYGLHGARGAWHVEHSIPKAHGGTEHLNNLFPAHIGCNLSKGVICTRKSRSAYGRTRAPYSVKKRKQRQTDIAFGRGATLAGIGGAIAGPLGFVIGAIVGVDSGLNENPDW